MDPVTLRNRLLVATGMWREVTGEALPRLQPGPPEQQVQQFELLLTGGAPVTEEVTLDD